LWLRSQGQSPFVWSVLGAIAQATASVEVVTGVVCPIMRIHPVIVAQATATAQQPLGGQHSQDLPTTDHFEQIAAAVDEQTVRESWVCGPDPERHRAAIAEYLDAGYDEVYVMQMGPDQAGMIDFYAREVLPAIT
jgi:alkanesulfonate monooxygenase SsuD/methylene tetrahydromethanopterin reductase-like flavin-dependent oxidoreductase (luciferase family)